eukprot:m.75889 g.75889  ORF g.75889 m.75889 type:complete len:1275 (-) comp17197_c0_seq1:75-3899(-)
MSGFEIDLDRLENGTHSNGNGTHSNGDGTRQVALNSPKRGSEADGSGLKTGRSSVDALDQAATTIPGPYSGRVGYFDLYRFATAQDKVLFWVAMVMATIHGAAWPAWSLLFGVAIGQFDPNDIAGTVDGMRLVSLIFLLAGVVVGLASGLHVAILSVLSVKQVERIRHQFVRSVLRQEMTFHSQWPGAKLEVMLKNSLEKLHSPLGTKFGDCIHQVMQGFIGLTIAFVYGWKLALVVLAFSPVLIASMGTFGYFVMGQEEKTAAAYQNAGVVADESLTLMRTIMQFSTYEQEFRHYSGFVQRAYLATRKVAYGVSLALGLPDFAVFLLYGLAFWYGSQLVRDGDIEGNDIVIVMFCAMIGFMGFGQSLAHVQEFIVGLTAAVPVFNVIDTKPSIDGLSEEGKKLDNMEGNIAFNNVRFAYPSHPSEHVLRGLSFSVSKGQNIALVGSSGSGKSTIVNLVEHFYDIQDGVITLDGVDLRELNVPWLRANIGLVTQNPVLFPMSIFENIAIGKENATLDDVVEAAKMANAHNFISEFPHGYDTHVGELGGQLSGGQRQRIAIARVLIKNPKILILDEATSALDNQSEAIVQEALDNAQTGRTTFTIAHRLSTVRNADYIVVLHKGEIVEEGTHEQLVAKQGKFYNMLKAQETEKESAAEQKDSEQNSAEEGESALTRTKSTKDKKEEEERLAASINTWEILKWAWTLARPDWRIIAYSLVGAAIVGALWPLLAVALSNALETVLEDASESAILPSVYTFIALGFGNIVGHFLRHSQASRASDRLTKRLRETIFRGILNQDCGWLDSPEHSNAILTSRLTIDAARVRTIVADAGTLYFMVVVMLGSSITLALVFCWRVGLVVLAFIPLLAISGVAMMKLMLASSSANDELMQPVHTLTSRVLVNVKLILTLARSHMMLQDLETTQQPPIQSMRASALRIFAVTGIAQFLTFAVFAVSFFWGSYVVQEAYCSFRDMFAAMIGILFSSIMSGVYLGQLPNTSHAKVSAYNIKNLLASFRSESERRAGSDALEIPRGEIEFRNVTFAYPTRPDAVVLKDFSLKIQAGEKIAFVGSSGSGKSTIVALLQRFYEPLEGEILVDGQNIKDFSVDRLRLFVAAVFQEPRLFSTTIDNNIRYGEDPDHPYTEAQVADAAQKANAMEFINDFELKFDTPVGHLGSELSGGQRQRVAIARVFMRDPKILLLDEATSALDSEAEKLVQSALNRAAEGRTTIIIAHRLSTISDADRIVVLDQGQVAEQGSHSQLLAANGRYYELYHSSS